jgi:NADH-quinone oxidoreductase subunit N
MHPTLAIGLPYIPGWRELAPFVADLWLVATAVAVLLTPFFTPPRRSNVACAVVALAGLTLALVSLIAVGAGAGVGEGPDRFRPMLVTDSVAFFWKVLLLLFVMGVILMWFSTTADSLHEGDGPEFFVLLVGATLGMSLMASASNLLMLFMAVEMASLPSYVLAGFRKTHRVGAEASLKYVLFGAATSAVMVYGLSMLYGLYGTLQLYSTTAADGTQVAGLAEMMTRSPGGAALLVVAVFGLIVGVGFKVSAVPFHFWCPDVFEGASIDVSAFLSVASKGAALVLLLRVFMAIGEAAGYAPVPRLTAIAVVVGVIGAVTATVGNTAAFVQTNIKRLLAYSSIAHAGYVLCAVSLLYVGPHARAGFTDPSSAAAQAILLYLAVYVFMNLGAFTVAGLVWRETGSESIDAYAGLGRRNPVLAVAMTAFMFSLVGLPPLAGFVAKVNVLWVLIQDGGWWWALVAVIGVNTILSLYYYLRVVKVMYLNDSEAPAFAANPLGTALSVACAAVLVAMFVGFNPLTNLTTAYSDLHPVKQPPAQRAAAPTHLPESEAVPVAGVVAR